MSMKNSNETIGNRTRDLPACNATAYPHQTQASGPVYDGGFVNKSKHAARFGQHRVSSEDTLTIHLLSRINKHSSALVCLFLSLSV